MSNAAALSAFIVERLADLAEDTELRDEVAATGGTAKWLRWHVKHNFSRRVTKAELVAALTSG